MSVSHLTTVVRDHYTWLYVGSQDLNSCPRVCAASVLFNPLQLLHSSLNLKIRDAQLVLYFSTGLPVRALCCVDKHSNRKCL